VNQLDPAGAGAQEGRPSLLCPSAPASSPGGRLIGVVGGTPDEPSVTFLGTPAVITADVLEASAPVGTGEVLRVAAPCAAQGCAHFGRGRCTLVERIVDLLPVVEDGLPACGIRASCRWFAQEGGDACRRCPQVVTENALPTPEFVAAAVPPARASRPEDRGE
jgi:hypothetical protein